MIDLDDGTGIYRNLERVKTIKRKTDGAHSPKLLDAATGFIEKNRKKKEKH